LQVIDWHKIVEEHGSAVWQTAYKLPGNHADAAEAPAGCPGPVQCVQDDELAERLRESILKLAPTEGHAFFA